MGWVTQFGVMWESASQMNVMSVLSLLSHPSISLRVRVSSWVMMSGSVFVVPPVLYGALWAGSRIPVVVSLWVCRGAVGVCRWGRLGCGFPIFLRCGR